MESYATKLHIFYTFISGRNDKNELHYSQQENLIYTEKVVFLNETKMKEECIMAILVTGGAGYIGSHTCVEL